jgi:RNA polymerase sigma-70 factor, ECF subfamily
MEARPTERWRVVDVAGLREVYDAVFDDVYRYAAWLAGPDRQLAEDLVQDAFVDLARRLDGGDSLDVSVGWFITVVRHRFIDDVRRRSSGAMRRGAVGEASTRDITAADGLDDAEKIVAGLSPIERLALVMRHVDGYSVREIATAIGRSRRATESVLARGRDRVRRMSTEERR